MEKCNKCGSKLSHLDVLCPRCCALVEKVQVFPVVPEELRTANTPEAKKSPPLGENNEIQYRHVPKPSLPDNTVSAVVTSNSHTESQPSFNSYAGSSAPVPIEPPRYEGRSPSAIHGAPTQDSKSSFNTSSDGELKDTLLPKEAPKPKQQTGRKNWLEIVEFPEPTYRRSEKSSEENAAPTAQQPETRSEKRRTRRTPDVKTAVAAPAHEKRPIFLTIFIWLLAAGVLFGVFHFLGRYITTTYGSYSAFVRELTAGRIDFDSDAAVANSVTILIRNAENELGEPVHIFEVSAYKGVSVRLLPTSQTYPMDNGNAVFIVSDKDLARALGIVTSADTYNADNISFVISTGRQQIMHSAGNVTLTMTPAPYSRSMPMLDSSATQSETANILISVDKAAKVYINQNDYSSHIDENGKLSLILPLELGENYFKVDVCQIGYKTSHDSFVIIRETE